MVVVTAGAGKMWLMATPRGCPPGGTPRHSGETLPALQLVSHDDDTRKEIGPDDRLYTLAAWAFHHAHRITLLGGEPGDPTSLDMQRGFFEALSILWPYSRQRAQKGGKRERVRLIHLLARKGVANGNIASALRVGVSSVEKLKREAREMFGRGRGAVPMYEVKAYRRENGPLEPPDPGKAFDLILRWLPLDGEEDRTARAGAVKKAKELGIDLFSTPGGTDAPSGL